MSKFSIGDRVVILESIKECLLNATGVVRYIDDYQRPFVRLDREDLHWLHDSAHGRMFVDRKLELALPSDTPPDIADYLRRAWEESCAS